MNIKSCWIGLKIEYFLNIISLVSSTESQEKNYYIYANVKQSEKSAKTTVQTDQIISQWLNATLLWEAAHENKGK